MSTKIFFFRLGVFSSLVAVFIFLQALISPLAPYISVGWMTWALFILLTTAMFLSGKMALKSIHPQAFDTLIISFNFLRIAASLILIFSYIRSYQPPDNWFILPFFAIYILFTIFEVDMLSKLGRESSNS